MENTQVQEKFEIIRLDLKDIEQLFNSLDPSPFIDKDLDQDAIEYLTSSFSEYNLKKKLKIIIHMPKVSLKKFKEKDIIDSIHNYFSYEVKMSEKRINLQIKEGRQALFIGLSFLLICLSVREYILYLNNTFVTHIITEALLISGWVAMWKPISNMLYDWWPLKKKQRIYNKIANTEIEFLYY